MIRLRETLSVFKRRIFPERLPAPLAGARVIRNVNLEAGIGTERHDPIVFVPPALPSQPKAERDAIVIAMVARWRPEEHIPAKALRKLKAKRTRR